MYNEQDISEFKNRIKQLEQENKNLHESVEYLTRKLFGRKSEKTSVLFKGQMSLFDEAEIEINPQAKEPTVEEIEGYKRKNLKLVVRNFLNQCRMTKLYAG